MEKEVILILLVDRKHGHFYRYDMTTHTLSLLEEVVDDVPRPTKGASWAGLADDKVARHIEGHVRDHFRRVIKRLDHYLRDPEYDGAKLMLGGPETEVEQFRSMLSKPTAERVNSIIHPDHYAGIKELESQIIQAAKAAAHNRIRAVLAQINESRSPNGRGVVGQEPVYEALNLKQVQVIICDPKHIYSGFICPKDGSLSQSSKRCPICLGAMEQRPNLIADIKKIAADQDATVLVATEGGELAAYDHLVALRRFSD